VTLIQPTVKEPKQLEQSHPKSSESKQDLNKKIKESIQISEKTIEEMEKPSKSIAPLQTALEDNDDVFKNYMRQKEKEYQEKKKKSEKSSSGNSSLSVQSNGDEQDDLIRLVNDENRRHVRFDITDESVASNRLGPLIETIDNELEVIRDSLKNSLKVNDDLNTWMRQVYEQDFENAQEMKASELEKVSKTAQLTNDVFLRAINEGCNQGAPKASLRVRPSSRSKGVLLPRSKSLVDYAKYKRECSPVVTAQSERMQINNSD